MAKIGRLFCLYIGNGIISQLLFGLTSNNVIEHIDKMPACNEWSFI